MRPTPFAFLSLLAALPCLQAAPAPAPSRISAVTVYEDRALVTRTLACVLPQGLSTLRFEGLPAGLDERTLRAGVDGTATAKVAGITSSLTRATAPADERVRALEAELEGLSDQAAATDEALRALGIERRYLEAYRQFSRAAFSEGTTAAAPATSDWNKTLAFLRERSQAADERGVLLARERRELQEKMAVTTSRLDQLRTPEERVTRTAEVTVEASQAGNATVSCTYQVGGAAWAPVYDARFDPEGKTIALGYFGAVRQQTGEDWTGVTITLSTARPSVGAARPKLAALQLSGRKREHRQEVALAGKMEEREINQAPGEAEAAGSGAGGGGTLALVQDQGPSVTFEIRQPASIPSDGRPARVAIAEAVLKPELAYEAIPKLRPYAYLKASQDNPTGLPLLAGPVQIHRASGYVGTADLRFTAPGQPLALSLGVDEAVKVHRTVLRETEEEGKGLRNRRVMTRAYDVEVANYTQAPQAVRLLDQIPVSQLEKVEVKLDPSTTAGAVPDKDGIMTWVLPLAPGEKRTVHLEFTVTMPENYRLP